MIMKRFRFYLPGIALISAAILIMAVPEILVAMVSTLIMIIGVIALVVGHDIQKSEIKINTMEKPFRTSGWHRYCFFRSNKMM
jgi:type IV secretory pathway VirB3-like protein